MMNPVALLHVLTDVFMLFQALGRENYRKPVVSVQALVCVCVCVCVCV